MENVDTRAREDLRRIFEAAVGAVDPALLMERYLRRDGGSNVILDGDRELARWKGAALIVGAGKASARMAEGCERVLGAESVRGLVVVPDGCGARLASVRIASAGHPLPDRRGVRATTRICELLAATERGPVLTLISGGASSLLVQPRRPVTLEEKQRATRRLLESGAPIDAVNAVRKHLSAVKGGGLLRVTGARPIVSFLLSDVVGDDPSVIGSGPTVPDPTRFDDACRVLEASGLDSELPQSVIELLRRGRRGEIPETLKEGDPEALGSHCLLIGCNRLAVEGAASVARKMGYETIVTEPALVGDTTSSARRWIGEVLAVRAATSSGLCVIAGGETTVAVRGSGKGGRNQEFALALAGALEERGTVVLSAGTDGIDGPTDAAGAFVDGSTLRRSRALGLDADSALQRNDSYGFFSTMGDLFRPGPTGTNVMDLKIAITVPSTRSLCRRPTLC